MADLEAHNKALIQRFGEAQNARRLDLFDDLVAADFVRHCQATPWIQVRSREELKRFFQQDWAAVPDGRVTPTHVVAEGDFVAVYATYTGTQTGPWGSLPPSGKHFELDFSGVFRIAGGQIAELWITWDNLAMLTQLGFWPMPGSAPPA